MELVQIGPSVLTTDPEPAQTAGSAPTVRKRRSASGAGSQGFERLLCHERSRTLAAEPDDPIDEPHQELQHLGRLVEEGIHDRVRYNERPERYEYRLTPKGRDLGIALAGLGQWGDKYLSKKTPRITRRRSDKRPVIAAFVPKGAEVLCKDEIESVPGPGHRA